MLGWWLAIALAAPGEFLRTRDSQYVRQFTNVNGDPARGHWQNPKGPYQAWTFRDGVVERYRKFGPHNIVEERTFDALGGPVVTTTWEAGNAKSATVHGIVDRALSLDGWTWQNVGPMWILAPKEAAPESPEAPATTPAGLRIRSPQLYLELRWVDGTPDVFSDGFRDALASTCACQIVDRATGFIANRAGARYLVVTPDPAGSRLGERWAVQGPQGKVLLVSYDVPMILDGTPVADDRYPAALAVGRTMLATAKW
jgi:hypothetical protein